VGVAEASCDVEWGKTALVYFVDVAAPAAHSMFIVMRVSESYLPSTHSNTTARSPDRFVNEVGEGGAGGVGGLLCLLRRLCEYHGDPFWGVN
jgi:hypothetical protein